MLAQQAALRVSANSSQLYMFDHFTSTYNTAGMMHSAAQSSISGLLHFIALPPLLLTTTAPAQRPAAPMWLTAR